MDWRGKRADHGICTQWNSASLFERLESAHRYLFRTTRTYSYADWVTRLKWTMQLIEVGVYLDKMGIYHRDIRCSNILVPLDFLVLTIQSAD